MFSAKFKNMLLSIIMLCALAAASGLILGFLNKLTYVDPNTESYKRYAKLAKTDSSFAMQAENIGDIVLFAKTEGEKPYFAFTVIATNGYQSETFDVYIIIYDNKILVIDENSEKQSWKGQLLPLYEEYYNQDLSGEVAFNVLTSGATSTSKAVKTALDKAVNYYKDYIQGAS